MIHLEDIQVTFNPGTILENRALRGVSIEVPEHQFLTVIGSNGAGKSTLLGAVTGETPMIGGRVRIDDLDVTRQTVDQRAFLFMCLSRNTFNISILIMNTVSCAAL